MISIFSYLAILALANLKFFITENFTFSRHKYFVFLN